MSLSWFGNSQQSWRRCLGRGRSVPRLQPLGAADRKVFFCLVFVLLRIDGWTIFWKEKKKAHQAEIHSSIHMITYEYIKALRKSSF